MIVKQTIIQYFLKYATFCTLCVGIKYIFVKQSLSGFKAYLCTTEYPGSVYCVLGFLGSSNVDIIMASRSLAPFSIRADTKSTELVTELVGPGDMANKLSMMAING